MSKGKVVPEGNCIEILPMFLSLVQLSWCNASLSLKHVLCPMPSAFTRGEEPAVVEL